MRKRFLHDDYDHSDQFWDRNWARTLAGVDQPVQVNRPLVRAMESHLPQGARVLEGGCGNCHYVRYLQARGYSVTGVDFAKKTVQNVKSLWPDLDVRQGDIRRLEFDDNSFDAYYSGGVIEHFEDGLSPQLQEAHRVIKNSGFFFVTVPFLNLLRRVQGATGVERFYIDLDGRKSYFRDGVSSFEVETAPKDYHFHEYMLTKEEAVRHFIAHGFEVVRILPFSIRWGLLDIPLMREAGSFGKENRHIGNKAVGAILRFADYVEASDAAALKIAGVALAKLAGNMQLYICRAVK